MHPKLIKKWFVRTMLSALCVLPAMALAEDGKSVVSGDFHMTLYPDMYGDTLEFEMFTKQAQANLYFGLACSAMSALPTLQLVNMEKELWSWSPRLLDVTLKVNEQAWQMNGILSMSERGADISNLVRLEFAMKPGESMRDVKARYEALLQALSSANTVSVDVKHRSFGEKSYQFSLEGFGKLLEPNQAVCR